MSLDIKIENLKSYIKSIGSVAVAFSSGVDSTFLLNVAYEILKDKVIAITAKSPLFPQRELDEAIEFCKTKKIKHILVETGIKEIEENPQNRCYICKKNIFSKFIQIAKENNLKHIIEGSNIDDLSDYRPGMQAIRELGIKSPLIEANLTKQEIRAFSSNKKPAFACLASRFVYGDTITIDKLKMVEKAENLLAESGFKQYRVRIHSNIARIEVLPDDFEKLLKTKDTIYNKFQEYGFKYVTMDLKGYRTGSMNEVI